eukprot:scaffold12970_cov113-Isochrysis_galbana.AAC.1
MYLRGWGGGASSGVGRREGRAEAHGSRARGAVGRRENPPPPPPLSHSLFLSGVSAPAHEEVVGQVGHAHKVLGEGAGGVGVHVIGHHHRLGAQSLGTLVVACGVEGVGVLWGWLQPLGGGFVASRLR